MSTPCAGRVVPAGTYYERHCTRSGVLRENDRWWCRQHAPSAVDERNRKAAAKTRTMLAAWGHNAELQKARQRVVETAKVAYGCYKYSDHGTFDPALAAAVAQLERLEAEAQP